MTVSGQTLVFAGSEDVDVGVKIPGPSLLRAVYQIWRILCEKVKLCHDSAKGTVGRITVVLCREAKSRLNG